MSTVPTHLGKYELQRKLGRGSVGEVWKGYDAELRRDVAIKIIHTDLQSDPNFLNHFMKERQVIVSLQHASIVPVRAVDVYRSPESSETTAYIVSDYIEGRTLSEMLVATSHRGIFPSIAQIVYLFTTLGVAIDYAHQRGVVHGNLKPNNILLQTSNTSHFEAGEPLLTDFALTQLLGNATSVISPLYISPEQAKGQLPSNRSDIYALGVILYEICTGVQPFRDESSVAVMMQHINTLPTPPKLINPNIPPALSEVILRAMAKDPVSRFPMASLLATAIADACSMRPSSQVTNISGAHSTEESPLALGPVTQSTGAILGVAQPQIPAPYNLQRPAQQGPFIPKQLTTVDASFSGKHPSLNPDSFSGKYPSLNPDSFSGKHPSLNSDSLPSNPTSKQTIPTTAVNKSISAPMSQVSQPSLPAISYSSAMMTPTNRMQSLPPQMAPTQDTNAMAALARSSRRSTRFTDMPVYVVIGSLLLLMLVIGSVIGATTFFNNKTTQTTNGTPALSGHVFFQDDALGHDDTIHIQLQNFPAPPQGQTYAAWLQDNTQQITPLGALTLQNGSASLVYNGNNQHTNLLANTSSVFITIENNISQLTTPSDNRVYQATFDAATLSYIKNILYSTPGVPENRSVIVQLSEAIKSMNDKAGSIVDSLQGTHDYGLVHRQAVRIIELLDGTANARSNGDLPAQEQALEKNAIGLLSSPKQQGLVDILAAQVAQVKQHAGNNTELLQHAQNVENAINDLHDWLNKIHDYDLQILKATNPAAPAVASVALQLKQAAADSYTGRTIPPNESPLPIPGSAGANQAYTESQYMAALAFQKV